MTLLARVALLFLQAFQQETGTNDQRIIADLQEGRIRGNELIKLGLRCNEPAIARAFLDAFESASDLTKKRNYASILIRYRSVDPRYYTYLEKRASEIVNSDAPGVFMLDSSGDPIRGKRNPQFDQWCMSHDLDPVVESRLQLMEDPSIISSLAGGADRRSIPIFIKGLHSNNPLVVVNSASGLAELSDEEFIGPIIGAAGASQARIDGLMTNVLTKFESSEKVIRLQLRGTRLLPVYERSLKNTNLRNRSQLPPPPGY